MNQWLSVWLLYSVSFRPLWHQNPGYSPSESPAKQRRNRSRLFRKARILFRRQHQVVQIFFGRNVSCMCHVFMSQIEVDSTAASAVSVGDAPLAAIRYYRGSV